MADDQSSKTKRRVKNPESFRERAVKAAEEGDKPKKTKRLRQAIGKVVTPIFRPIGKALSKIAKFKIFKPFRKPLRFIGKILFPTYLRNSWQELKLVTWPSWKQSRQLTSAVLIFAFVFGVIVAVVDYGLDKLFKDILLK